MENQFLSAAALAALLASMTSGLTGCGTNEEVSKVTEQGDLLQIQKHTKAVLSKVALSNSCVERAVKSDDRAD